MIYSGACTEMDNIDVCNTCHLLSSSIIFLIEFELIKSPVARIKLQNTWPEILIAFFEVNAEWV